MAKTAEEKFEEDIKKMSREEKIERLANIDCWDMESLCEFAEIKLRESYESMNDNDLDDEYYDAFDCDVWDYEDDDEKESLFVCNDNSCPMTAWGINHHVDCPERKNE